jgi:predicted ArsR family transcriptional regulator
VKTISVQERPRPGVSSSAPTTSVAIASRGRAGGEPVDQLDHGTRERVARALLLERAVTASAISAELGLTPAAVRRHLDALEADGLAQPYELLATGQRGRPARAFRLTEAGRDRFPDGYEDLALSALRFLGANGGQQAVDAFARDHAQRLERRLGDWAARPAATETKLDPTAGDTDEAPGDDVLAARFAEALTQAGYPSSVRPGGSGVQLCQHHCPVAHIATAFPQLCEAETEVFAQVLGRHVQRLATIAHGDGVCTTHIPARPDTARTSSPSTPDTTGTPDTSDTGSAGWKDISR